MSLALASRRASLLAPWNKNALWRRARSVPSLDLRFADNKSLVDSVTGQQLVTHTRGSSAAYTDSQGVVRTATTNLLLWSEDFSNPAWSATNGVVTANFTNSPAGTLTADRFTENTGSVDSRFPVGVSLVAGAAYTLSVYAKVIPGSAQRYLMLVFNTGFSSVAGANFNLVAGTIGATNGASGSIQSVGNGWYRCSITPSSNATGSGSFRIRTCAVDNSGNITSPATYTGDGLSGFDFFGAQLEQSSTVGEYVPTTSAINSAPRFTHNPVTGESLGLLVEEQRTNLLLRSEEFDDAYWAKNATSITANNTPSLVGLVTADRLVEDSANSQHTIGSQVIPWLGNTQYTFTLYAKAAGRDTFDLLLGTAGNWVSSNRAAIFNLTSGTVEFQDGSPVAASIQNVGGGWFRCRITCTTVASPSASGVFLRLYDKSSLLGGLGSYQGNGTSGIYLWGAQLEAGAFPTSYIPTTTAAVTRAADVVSITGTNFSSWYRQDQGTMYSRATVIGSTGATQPLVHINDGSEANRAALVRRADGNGGFFGSSASVAQYDLSSATSMAVGAQVNLAAAYQAASFALSQDNAALVTLSSGTVTTLDRLSIGSRPTGTYFNGTISRLTYWPVRLINTVLQAITQ